MSTSASGTHPCETPGCNLFAMYDDEPHCFKHSPDSGSYVPGYSYRREHKQELCDHVWDDELEHCDKCGLVYGEWEYNERWNQLYKT